MGPDRRAQEREGSIPRLWIILSAGVAVMFSTLLALGWHIYQQARSIPQEGSIWGALASPDAGAQQR